MENSPVIPVVVVAIGNTIIKNIPPPLPDAGGYRPTVAPATPLPVYESFTTPEMVTVKAEACGGAADMRINRMTMLTNFLLPSMRTHYKDTHGIP
jgi:hypothetical protein